MLTRSIRKRRTTESGLSPTYIFSFLLQCSFSFSKRKTHSKPLKVNNLLIHWDYSSAGEHYAEDVGVLGSTPSNPIATTPNRFRPLEFPFKFVVKPDCIKNIYKSKR